MAVAETVAADSNRITHNFSHRGNGQRLADIVKRAVGFAIPCRLIYLMKG